MRPVRRATGSAIAFVMTESVNVPHIPSLPSCHFIASIFMFRLE